MEMTEYTLRVGDRKMLFLTKEQIRADLEASTLDAADFGSIPVLTGNELDKLAEILMTPARMIDLESGKEVPVTHDIGTIRLDGNQHNSCVGIPTIMEIAVGSPGRST